MQLQMNKPKSKGKKQFKTRNLMLNQSAEQNAASSIRIEQILTTDLKGTISHYLKKYGPLFDKRLGLTRDDILNDMREQIWKALITHDPTKSAGLRTYLSTLVTNRFRVLLRRSSIPKYTCIDYYGDIYESAGIDEETLITDETGETLFERRQTASSIIRELEGTDAWCIFGDLLLGCDLEEMMTRNKMTRVQVTAAILKIDALSRRQVS